MIFIQCSPNRTENATANRDSTTTGTLNNNTGDRAMRGKYLVTVAGCNDCHSPKTMTAQGPIPDQSKLLSGHPAEMGIPKFDVSLVGPGKFAMCTQDLTAWAGPWGISFPINLTPDSATGIGGWSEETFVRALKTGKHMGAAAGRPILPPMPWQDFSQMTDEDLRAVFTFLRTLTPVSNRVPDPVAFSDMGKK